MLHRLIFSLLLIASFGFAQIGALTHEISHYTDATAQNQQQDFNNSANKNSGKNANNNQRNQEPHNQVCEKCVSYAELGNAVSSSHVALALTISTHLLSSSSLSTFLATKPRHYSARAPPILA